MKKIVTEERTVCDFCEKTGIAGRCIECGRIFCHRCQKNGTIITYVGDICFCACDEGKYCKECNDKLEQNPDKLFTAYKQMTELKKEYDKIYDDLREKEEPISKIIEEEVKRKIKNRKDDWYSY